jgi:hypothetical protein
MAAAGIDGRCHCGRVTVRLPRTPESITQCNCSLCSKTGFRGVYFGAEELQVAGAFDSYVREDLKQPYLATHRCAHCGTVTHWTPLSDPPHERMGVNARLFDETDLADIPVKHIDGASWDE